jgi:O-antigen/teichoic acid export membrane protein
MYTPVKKITYIFNSILFPSFSQIKEPNKIIIGYFRSVQLVSMRSLPLMAIISYNAEFIIPFIFGSKWVGAIPLVQILAFAGAIQSVSLLGSVIFSSIGKPEINIYLALIRSALVVVAIFIGNFYGIIMITKLLVISSFLSLILIALLVRKYIDFSLLNYFRYMKGSLINVFILTIAQIFFVNVKLLNDLELIKIFSMILVTIVTTYIFHSEILNELYRIIKNKLSTDRN